MNSDPCNVTTEFPARSDGGIYLNHAAVSPWPKCAYKAVLDFAEDNWRNGATNYNRWLAVENSLRNKLAKLINAESGDDISLLKSTSEGLSFIASGLAFGSGDEIVIPAEEFPSNRIPWEALSKKNKDIHIRQIEISGSSKPEAELKAACGRKTRIMSVSAVQYISGLRLQLSDLGEFCRNRGILLCVDGIQQLGAIPMDVQQEYIDFVVADGHKWLLGPEGLALFYCRPELREELELTEYGWHMVRHAGDYSRKNWEPATDGRRFECGSPNLLAAHALDASIGMMLDYGVDNISNNILTNTSYLIENIEFNDIEIITPKKQQSHAGIVSCRFPEAVKIQQLLLSAGINCACRDGALRISPHFYQNPAVLDVFIKKFRTLMS